MLRPLLAVALALASGVAVAGEPDRAGCKDHPLFTRVPGYHIVECSEREFDALQVRVGRAKSSVEGRVTQLRYQADQGANVLSALAVQRNYEDAIKKVGGSVVFSADGYSTLKLVKDGSESWAALDTHWGRGYKLSIAHKQLMKQEIVANAEAFSNDLKANGHAAVYGIYFDTAKAELRPESEPALQEIAKLLAVDPKLKLQLVGHTDAVGQLESNMKLSQARAEAVVQALAAKHGVAPVRLKAYGVGPLAPVATNRTDEGRAKNRRVELVED
jgi:outer membrane protein OmpA-like peptidoglycan-associated protein